MERAMQISYLPPLPKEWSSTPGWTFYEKNNKGQFIRRQVPFPEENLLFFDVEVCMTDGKLPTLAVALSPNKWYSWCSNRLSNDKIELPEFVTLNHLIPLEDENTLGNVKSLVIGHNVAFDRQFIREQYLEKESAMKFWCTMSMHIACSGMADHQRRLYEKSKLNSYDYMSNFYLEDEDGNPVFTKQFQAIVDEWKSKTCKNSLEAVFNHYCSSPTQIKLEKEWQGFFRKNSIEDIRDNMQQLFSYCAEDVRATFEVYQKLYPKFCKRFPHPLTSCGMMEMTNVYLPINANWRHFYDKCEKLSSSSMNEITRKVVQIARNIIDEMDQSIENKIIEKEVEENGEVPETLNKYHLDPWLWVSNWSRPKKRPQWPVWYWGLFQKLSDANTPLEELQTDSVKIMCREMPRLFGLCYGPYPLMFVTDLGWGYIVPKRNFVLSTLPETQLIKIADEAVHMPIRSIYKQIKMNQKSLNQLISEPLKSAVLHFGDFFSFYRLPHPSGQPHLNVGTPFSKKMKINFENFEEDAIHPTRHKDILERFLDSRNVTRFWGNYRARYKEQLPVWFDENSDKGAIAPSVIPAGTVTRRAVHKLWLTSANPKKSMIQCSSGYSLVGADVDSQEQWIAALFGDSLHPSKRAGSTAFSAMLLAGNKADKTDLHSVVAKTVGISRDHAKVLNYARLYGAGSKHAEQFLKTQGISDITSKKLTKKLFETTKGKASKYHRLSESGGKYFEEYLDYLRSQNKIAEKPDKNTFLLIDGCYFLPHVNYGNFTLNFAECESNTFNYLSLKSHQLYPETPVLKCRLSEALEPFPINRKNGPEAYAFNTLYKRTIINWFVQSSAVDFLHMLLVCMRWLCTTYRIRARFMISIHDEVRYMVADEDKYRCALALTLSNMYVRAAISESLGIRELPRSVAFFSQVDIDKVLRKEVTLDCETPNGEKVENGEALTIEQIIDKTGGSLEEDLNINKN
uniref:DNA-directed DNA polymerase n=1 Tax=Meloidogyne hapla TaxID=6305 RepID=A0A1I8BN44_MELHA